MIKVFVFVSGLAMASLPINSDGEPIVMAFPDAHHELSVFIGSPAGAGTVLEEVGGINAKRFSLGIAKKCEGNNCLRSRFPLRELSALADVTLLAGPESPARPECASQASVAKCLDGSNRSLLAGVAKLEGDWTLAALTDCVEDEFPFGLSVTANETFVNAKNIKESKPLWTPRPLADTFRFETEVDNLSSGLEFSGFPAGFELKRADPRWCKKFGDDSSECALLLLRYEPNPKPSPSDRLAQHFGHLYSLLTSQPAKPWAPFVNSGDYCQPLASAVGGGGHPRCLGGFVSY